MTEVEDDPLCNLFVCLFSDLSSLLREDFLGEGEAASDILFYFYFLKKKIKTFQQTKLCATIKIFFSVLFLFPHYTIH